jgi:hypothetical protein
VVEYRNNIRVFSIVGEVLLDGISEAQVFITRKIEAERKSCEKV